MMNMTVMIGMMAGNVTWIICLMRPAPSISAASYSAGSTLVIAARYTIEPQPMDFHISVMIRMGINAASLLRNG